MSTQSQPANAVEDEDLRKIRDALTGLQFGEVTVIVQDGVVVQVERTERVRLNAGRAKR